MKRRNVEELQSAHCVPCEGGVAAIPPEEARTQLTELPGWKLSENGQRIHREWLKRDFVDAFEFFEAVANLAEEEAHHPDLHLTEYRRARVELWTHAIGGLSQNDFILAAKIDAIADAVD